MFSILNLYHVCHKIEDENVFKGKVKLKILILFTHFSVMYSSSKGQSR